MVVAVAPGGLIAPRQLKRVHERLLKITVVSIGLALAAGCFCAGLTSAAPCVLACLRKGSV